MLSILGKNFSGQYFEFFFLFSLENKMGTWNLSEMLAPVSYNFYPRKFP